VFETMYTERGRPSIPPEALLKSCLLIALYSVRRLLKADVARRFIEGAVQQAKAARLLSADHFTVDGTLLEAGSRSRVSGRRRSGPGTGGRPMTRESRR
jgi:hypothetical protein